MVADTDLIHASCISFDGRGLLILGDAGAGKSGLALELMAFGAKLVADDRVLLQRRGNAVFAMAPQRLRGLIEARGVGILNADAVEEVQIHLIADLAWEETERLPPKRVYDLLEIPIALVFAGQGRHFPFAILQYLKAGRAE